MKILIVSDTHGKHKNLKEILSREKEIDLMIHLGDVEGGEEEIIQMAGCPVEMVSGNNDFFCDLEREKELQIGKYKVLITHGHYYYVAAGVEHLIKEAFGRGADIVMFGHTHYPMIRREGGLTVINPGSLSYPRQEGRRPSYIVMETDPQGGVEFFLKFL